MHFSPLSDPSGDPNEAGTRPVGRDAEGSVSLRVLFWGLGVTYFKMAGEM